MFVFLLFSLWSGNALYLTLGLIFIISIAVVLLILVRKMMKKQLSKTHKPTHSAYYVSCHSVIIIWQVRLTNAVLCVFQVVVTTPQEDIGEVSFSILIFKTWRVSPCGTLMLLQITQKSRFSGLLKITMECQWSSYL